MAVNSNLWGRYVWLIDTVRRHGKISYQEISDLWQESELGYGDKLPWRTFMNHRKAIEEIFDINIEVDKHDGYKYYIEDAERLEGDGFRSWLIDSYATLNQLQADQKLNGRIHYDRVPSGHEYLTIILEAMRKNRVVELSYQSFGRKHPYNFPFEPYHVKIHNRRWYVIGRSPHYDEIRTYCLDRIKGLKITDETFKMDKDFNIGAYFEGGVGVLGFDTGDIERVVIKCKDYSRDYVETLPIHSSQKEIDRGEDYITFEMNVRVNFELIQQLLMQVDQIEVLEPQSLRDKMARIGKRIMNMHK